MTQASPSAVVVTAANHAALPRAQQVAETLGLPNTRDWRQSSAQLALIVDIDGASLQHICPNPPGPVAIDFAAPVMEHRRRGGQNELLARAVGVKLGRYPRVFDATAGLGRDGFVLADSGCRVTLCERSPVLAWLLQQAVELGAISAIDHVRDASARMSVIAGDACQQSGLTGCVIYLDPMFPERRSQAAVKKDLAVLQVLHGGAPSDETDGESLLVWALQQQTPRVVIKRPLKAPPLGGLKPAYQLKGKAVRFDVHVLGDLE
jgi:16S rRNA (guanine1516-N2)-methyltransferase